MSALLALEGVGRRHRRGELARWVLRGVTLHVAPGEVVAVVAMRGQGKTTLLRLAAGVVAPDEGRVRLGREDLAGLSEPAHARVLRERIGWAGRLGPGIDVRMLDYVALPLAVGGRARRLEVRTRALAALERVGAEQCAERRWEELSDWERALVELAQASAGAPRLLLVDDLLDGLGMRETAALGALVRALARELHAGVLMTVSDPEAALGCDRVLSLADGRLTVMAGGAGEQDGEEPEGGGAGNVIDLPRGRARSGRHGA